MDKISDLEDPKSDTLDMSQGSNHETCGDLIRAIIKCSIRIAIAL